LFTLTGLQLHNKDDHEVTTDKPIRQTDVPAATAKHVMTPTEVTQQLPG